MLDIANYFFFPRYFMYFLYFHTTDSKRLNIRQSETIETIVYWNNVFHSASFPYLFLLVNRMSPCGMRDIANHLNLFCHPKQNDNTSPLLFALFQRQQEFTSSVKKLYIVAIWNRAHITTIRSSVTFTSKMYGNEQTPKLFKIIFYISLSINYVK